MDPITAIITLAAAAPQIEGGIEAVANLIAVWHQSSALTDDQLADIRSRGEVADTGINDAIDAAKKRLGTA